MTTSPISITIHITIQDGSPAATVRIDDALGLKAMMGAPAGETFPVRAALTHADGSGKDPETLSPQLQELWKTFASCVNGGSVQSVLDLVQINEQIGRRFHGAMHQSGEYLKGTFGSCVQSWLTQTGAPYTFSRSTDPATRPSRRNGLGGWDPENPGMQYAVRNGDTIAAYMGIETDAKIFP